MEATRRVRLSLIVNHLLDTEGLRPSSEAVRAHLQELAMPYDDPAAVVKWYEADRERLAQVEGHLLERCVLDFVLSKAQVQKKLVSFDEAMKRDVSAHSQENRSSEAVSSNTDTEKNT